MPHSDVKIQFWWDGLYKSHIFCKCRRSLCYSFKMAHTLLNPIILLLHHYFMVKFTIFIFLLFIFTILIFNIHLNNETEQNTHIIIRQRREKVLGRNLIRDITIHGIAVQFKCFQTCSFIDRIKPAWITKENRESRNLKKCIYSI